MLPNHKVIIEDLEEIAAAIDYSDLYGARVLVTGASGFLAAYMVETLLFLNEQNPSRKIKVIGLARNREKAHQRFSQYLTRKDFELIIQPVETRLEIEGDLDFIIHAASQASPKHFGTDPVGTLSANIFGTHELLQLARQKKCRAFLFFSSGEVYGQVSPSQIPIKETDYGYLDPNQVRACYGESKRMGENLCVAFSHQFGVPTKIVRPFHTYGPGFSLEDGRVFADFVSDIINGRNIQLKSDGSAVRPYCYLSDATVGFYTVLLRGNVGEAYNIGNDKTEVSVLELARILVDLFPEKHLKITRTDDHNPVQYLKSPIQRNCPDISKVKALGWSPSISIQEGFKRTVRSFYEST
jgi:nucleoside-diphosphate-sugar epimerase